MIRRFLLILSVCAAGPLYSQSPVSEGPIYDKQGHLIAYQYSDGKRDIYSYDAAWRMISFVGRDGALVRYVYKSDGTVQEIREPGNAR